MFLSNNDILRRLRYCFDFSDAKMIDIFKQAECAVTREDVSNWLKKETEETFEPCSDRQLATFLNGMISDRRGKKPGPAPVPEDNLNNNIIIRKLKIALDLQADDILEMLALRDVKISKHELSSFFRRPDHRNFRPCQDQFFRKFLSAIQDHYRDNPPAA